MPWYELGYKRSKINLVGGRVLYIHVHTDLYIDLCVCVSVVSIIIAIFAVWIENVANRLEFLKFSFSFLKA